MNKYGESVDLLAAYRSVYEHHQKDKDGNTIPHEDEEVNEGKIPAGLQAYLDKKKGKKEEVINEMKMGDVSGSADFASRNIKGAKGAAPTPTPKPAPKTETTAADRPKPKTETDKMLDKVSDRRVEKAVNRSKDVRRATAKRIMTQYGENIDLLAAYRSIYEHHKKDADGNTIPHEDEEIKEGNQRDPETVSYTHLTLPTSPKV